MTDSMTIDVLHPRVIPEPNSGCWIWLGAVSYDGYGRTNFTASSYKMAHRVAYEAARGSIPAGLTIDHLCFNTYCVNPDHMEPVTPEENSRRIGARHYNFKKTHCPKGHPYDATNTLIKTGPRGRRGRYCRECRAQSNAADYQRRKNLKRASP